MSNYRVRQVLALGPMPERQLRLLIALATWMSDDTRTVRTGFETLITETGNTHNTVRNARRELEALGMLDSQGGRGKGNLTVWTVLCLPEKGVNAADPLEDSKGTNEVGTFSGDLKGTSEVGPFTPVDNSPKGTNREPQKVPTEDGKRYQGQRADQQEPEMGFNLWAKPLGSLSPSPGLHADLAAVVPDVTERETQGVIEILRKRGAKSVGAVLRAEIRDGTAGALVDEVRRRIAPPGASSPRPCDTQFGDQCQRCSLNHGQGQCREPEQATADMPAPPKLAAVPPPDDGDQEQEKPKCRYAACPGRADPIGTDGYHTDTCVYLKGFKPRPGSKSVAREQPEAS